MRTLVKIGMLCLAFLAIVAFPLHAAVGGLTLASYGIVTNTDVSKIWRKSQGELAMGYNFMVSEFGWVKDFKELQIDASLREMTFPVDLTEAYGTASIPEGGKRAQPSTVNAEEATVQFIHLNGRFTLAFLAQWANQADGGRGAVKKQLKWEAGKKVQAVSRAIANQFYGFSTAYYAQVDGDPGGSGASHTITMKNIYGSSSLPVTTTNAKNYICNLFKVGQQVALIRSGALVANGIGTITAITAATPSIAVTWIPGNCDPADADYIVPAESSGQSLLAHTDYNRHLVGLLDQMTSDSVHSLAASSVPNWSAAYSDTASGRFSGTKWRKALDEIQNYGDENAKVVTLMSKGVRRDVTAQYAAGVRFDDPFGMEIDGDFTAGGTKPKSTLRVPPGAVLMFDSAKGLRKKTIFDSVKDGDIVFGDGQPAVDDAGMIFDVDWAGFICTTNRKLQAYFLNQSES